MCASWIWERYSKLDQNAQRNAKRTAQPEHTTETTAEHIAEIRIRYHRNEKIFKKIKDNKK